jgi:AhpD family alkylhydroperoxidase
MTAPAWMQKIWPEGGDAFTQYAAAVNGHGVLDAKTRTLILLASSSLERCPHCVSHHLETLQALGATKAEIAEAMMLASVAAAGANMTWAAEVFHQHLVHREKPHSNNGGSL